MMMSIILTADTAITAREEVPDRIFLNERSGN